MLSLHFLYFIWPCDFSCLLLLFVSSLVISPKIQRDLDMSPLVCSLNEVDTKATSLKIVNFIAKQYGYKIVTEKSKVMRLFLGETLEGVTERDTLD